MPTTTTAARVPRLALVPRDQLRAAGAEPKRQQQQPPLRRRHLLADELARASAKPESDANEFDGQGGDDDDEVDLEADPTTDAALQQLRLGERFLRMMAAMARLSRWPLQVHSDDAEAAHMPAPPSPRVSNDHHQPAPSPSDALQRIVAKKKATLAAQKLSPHKPSAAAASPAKGAAAPLLVPANVATEPLRPHLTFEISMLLPQPIDTRQSPLQSPIRRKPLRRRRGRRRRLRREKRSWTTSHATWVPHASAAYIEAHGAKLSGDVSRLMAKFAQLKSVSSTSSGLSKSQSLPALDRRTFLYAFPKPSAVGGSGKTTTPERDASSGSDDGDENGGGDLHDADDDDDESDDDDGAESETHAQQLSSAHETLRGNTSASGDNELPFSSRSPTTYSDDAASHTYPHETPRSSPQADAASSPPTTPKRPLFHRPALISPELHAWLVDSGMFQTRRRPAHRQLDSAPTTS